MASALLYGANYLSVFEVGTNDEKRRHAQELYDAANEVAQHTGYNNFVMLVEGNSPSAWSKALSYASNRWGEFEKAPPDDRYWLSAFALVELMILNLVHSLNDDDDARSIADNAAYLYSAEYSYQMRS